MSKTFKELVDDSKTRIREVTVDDVKGMLAQESPEVIVDIREESE